MKLEKIKNLGDFKSLSARLHRHGFETTLQDILTTAAKRHPEPLTLFFRDDDVAQLTPNLLRLTNTFLEKSIALHLLIIPDKLLETTTAFLRGLKKKYPQLIFLCQHGWSHENHCRNGKKHEFGDTRSSFRQFKDIAAGKEVLSQMFLNDLFLAFTPPWNRYNTVTTQTLKELGFKVLSADGGKVGLTDSDLIEISTAVDTHHCRPNPVMKNPAHLLYELQESFKKNNTIGILLHHEELCQNEFEFLDHFLVLLKRNEKIRFSNFAQIYSKLTEPDCG